MSGSSTSAVTKIAESTAPNPNHSSDSEKSSSSSKSLERSSTPKSKVKQLSATKKLAAKESETAPPIISPPSDQVPKKAKVICKKHGTWPTIFPVAQDTKWKDSSKISNGRPNENGQNSSESDSTTSSVTVNGQDVLVAANDLLTTFDKFENCDVQFTDKEYRKLKAKISRLNTMVHQNAPAKRLVDAENNILEDEDATWRKIIVGQTRRAILKKEDGISAALIQSPNLYLCQKIIRRTFDCVSSCKYALFVRYMAIVYLVSEVFLMLLNVAEPFYFSTDRISEMMAGRGKCKLVVFKLAYHFFTICALMCFVAEYIFVDGMDALTSNSTSL